MKELTVQGIAGRTRKIVTGYFPCRHGPGNPVYTADPDSLMGGNGNTFLVFIGIGDTGCQSAVAAIRKVPWKKTMTSGSSTTNARRDVNDGKLFRKKV